MQKNAKNENNPYKERYFNKNCARVTKIQNSGFCAYALDKIRPLDQLHPEIEPFDFKPVQKLTQPYKNTVY